MNKLTLSEAVKVSGGTSNLELKIPPRFRLLIEAIEQYASCLKDFAPTLEQRTRSGPKRDKRYRRRPSDLDT